MADFLSDIQKIETAVNTKKLELAKLEERRSSLEIQIQKNKDEIAKIVPANISVEEWLKNEEIVISEGVNSCKKILQLT